jgi:hypothetical protein
MTRFTLGTLSAPYWASQVLKIIGYEPLESEKDASNIMLSRFSIDDMLVIFKTIAESQENIVKIKKTLQQYGFNSRIFVFNHQETLIRLDSESISKIIEVKKMERMAKQAVLTSETLGLFGNQHNDPF